jgi:hypothetical protein
MEQWRAVGAHNGGMEVKNGAEGGSADQVRRFASLRWVSRSGSRSAPE